MVLNHPVGVGWFLLLIQFLENLLLFHFVEMSYLCLLTAAKKRYLPTTTTTKKPDAILWKMMHFWLITKPLSWLTAWASVTFHLLANYPAPWQTIQPPDKLSSPLANHPAPWQTIQPTGKLSSPLSNYPAYWQTIQPTGKLSSLLANYPAYWQTIQPPGKLSSPLKESISNVWVKSGFSFFLAFLYFFIIFNQACRRNPTPKPGHFGAGQAGSCNYYPYSQTMNFFWQLLHGHIALLAYSAVFCVSRL